MEHDVSENACCRVAHCKRDVRSSSCDCSRRLQADLAPLNEELLQLVQRLQPSPEERSQQASAFDAVRQLLQACAVLCFCLMCEAGAVHGTQPSVLLLWTSVVDVRKSSLGFICKPLITHRRDGQERRCTSLGRLQHASTCAAAMTWTFRWTFSRSWTR